MSALLALVAVPIVYSLLEELSGRLRPRISSDPRNS